ncbi:MAG: helix-turn-helix transcriptional regulator [Victivallales bacterium]|nr:helix-turn-helix transcriptional regulator [Victivallales bacterium]
MSENKELMRGTVEVVILRLLSEHDLYGYEMIKLVNERSNGYFEWREGSLYPCLHKLEGDGMVRSYMREGPGKARRYYTLTEEGRKVAVERATFTREFCAALSLLLQPVPEA